MTVNSGTTDLSAQATGSSTNRNADSVFSKDQVIGLLQHIHNSPLHPTATGNININILIEHDEIGKIIANLQEKRKTLEETDRRHEKLVAAINSIGRAANASATDANSWASAEKKVSELAEVIKSIIEFDLRRYRQSLSFIPSPFNSNEESIPTMLTMTFEKFLQQASRGRSIKQEIIAKFKVLTNKTSSLLKNKSTALQMPIGGGLDPGHADWLDSDRNSLNAHFDLIDRHVRQADEERKSERLNILDQLKGLIKSSEGTGSTEQSLIDSLNRELSSARQARQRLRNLDTKFRTMFSTNFPSQIFPQSDTWNDNGILFDKWCEKLESFCGDTKRTLDENSASIELLVQTKTEQQQEIEHCKKFVEKIEQPGGGDVEAAKKDKVRHGDKTRMALERLCMLVEQSHKEQVRAQQSLKRLETHHTGGTGTGPAVVLGKGAPQELTDGLGEKLQLLMSATARHESLWGTRERLFDAAHARRQQELEAAGQSLQAKKQELSDEHARKQQELEATRQSLQADKQELLSDHQRLVERLDKLQKMERNLRQRESMPSVENLCTEVLAEQRRNRDCIELIRKVNWLGFGMAALAFFLFLVLLPFRIGRH